MLHMKQPETENLLALIFQSGGQVMVKDGQLLVGPAQVARRFGDQIKRLKPEILIALGHCPICAGELVSKIEETSTGKTGRHAYCPTLGHEDKWEF